MYSAICVGGPTDGQWKEFKMPFFTAISRRHKQGVNYWLEPTVDPLKPIDVAETHYHFVEYGIDPVQMTRVQFWIPADRDYTLTEIINILMQGYKGDNNE